MVKQLLTLMIIFIHLFMVQANAKSNDLVDDIKEIQKKLFHKLHVSNTNYKVVAERHQREQTFIKKDYVMFTLVKRFLLDHTKS